MLIGKEMAGPMNAQIGHEFGASLQYVNVAGYFDNAELPVLAQFFLKQVDEERMHGMKFVRYIHGSLGRWPPPRPASRHSPSLSDFSTSSTPPSRASLTSHRTQNIPQSTPATSTK